MNINNSYWRQIQIKNTPASTIPSPNIHLQPPETAPVLSTGFEYCNRTTLTNNNQTAPPAITEFITITEEERQEGLINAAKQEIEDCNQKLNDIQCIIENPEDDRIGKDQTPLVGNMRYSQE